MTSDKKEFVCLAGPLIESKEESNAWRKRFEEECVRQGCKVVSPVDVKKSPEQK